MDITAPVSKPKPRPRPQVMKLTEAAAQRVAELTKRADSEIVGFGSGSRMAAVPVNPIRWNMPMTCVRPTKSSRTRA